MDGDCNTLEISNITVFKHKLMFTFELKIEIDQFPFVFFSDSAKPKFTRQLKDIFCKDGDNVTLECEIQGQPRPQITWYRESKEILDSQVRT